MSPGDRPDRARHGGKVSLAGVWEDFKPSRLYGLQMEENE